MGLKLWLKHRRKRLLVKWRRVKKSRGGLIFDNSEQEHAFNVIDKLIRNLDSELLLAPISKRKYVKNGDIFVIMYYENVRIINGVYHYEFNFRERVANALHEKFLNRIERDRLKMENTVTKKVEKSLTTILESI